MISIDELNEYLEKMRKLIELDDDEIAHIKADNILCEILMREGYNELVALYDQVPKWYS